MPDADLFAQQAANRRRSRWLALGFVLFFAWVGFGGDIAIGLLTADAPPGAYHHRIPVIGIVFTLVAGGICWTAWRTGARRVLWATGAHELVAPATPAEGQLVNVVEEMAIAGGIPAPKIWIVEDADPNAFATGTDAEHANVAVTRGLLELLSRDELQGVIAHELAHVRNLDVRLMTLLAGMVGAIALMSDGMGRVLRGGVRIGGGSRGSSRSGGSEKGSGGGNPLGLVLLVLWLLTLVVAPLISRILAMSVSRKREFLADATAAQLTRNPGALASALERLDGATGATRSIAQGAAHLCIVDPGERHIAQRSGALADLFASHPPIAERVARLREMGYIPAPIPSGQ